MATRKEIEDAKKKQATAAKKDDKAQKGQVRLEYNQATTGLNMDSTINQVKTGSLTYALNATVENFDSSSVNYQNEPGNEPCFSFPDGYELIGKHTIPEKKKNIFFLVNPVQGKSEIGFMFNNDCQYQTLVNADCLNFNLNNPIHKVVHRITNCTTEIYWTDGLNPRRYLDIDNVPYELISGSPNCGDAVYSNNLDCNQLKIQPNFSIPFLDVEEVDNIGQLTAGVYQFAVQYSDAAGNDLTSYYSVTNPCPIADPLITSVNFDYPVGKSIKVKVFNLDTTGQFEHFNLAVIKTINNITSVELVGTYSITEDAEDIIYTGTDQTPIQLSIADIFEKYPYYDVAQDLTSAQDTLIWSNLTSVDRINYQQIASKITLQWETYRIPASENYANELNAINYRGYMRDEVYAFDIVFLLKNGKQTDSFHIPGPENLNPQPDVPSTNNDFIGEPDYFSAGIGYSQYWKIYNNAFVVGTSAPGNSSANYKGPWEYGNFAYWESTEEYPCNDDVWGDLAGKKIRHHKFPDVLVSPIIENGEIVYDGDNIAPVMQDDAIFPIGVRIDNAQIFNLIHNSNLTQEQKDDIVAYKIVRGDRSTNRSVIAKGILRNVNKYVRDDDEYYYPNYPYNQVSGTDSFVQENNNAWNGDGQSKPYLVYLPPDAEMAECNPNEENCDRFTIPELENVGVFTYTSVNNGKRTEAYINKGCVIEVCSRTRPVWLKGRMTIGPGDYDVWRLTSACRTGGYRARWYNPFNNINADFNIKSERWVYAFCAFDIGNVAEENVITPVDPLLDYDSIDPFVWFGGNQGLDQYGRTHAWKPTAFDQAPNASPQIGINPIANSCEVDEAGNVTVITNPDYLVTETVGDLNNTGQYTAQSCVQPEEGQDEIAFGLPTNPNPVIWARNTDLNNLGPVGYEVFRPADNLDETLNGGQFFPGLFGRLGRRSCLQCDKDIPITPLEGLDAEEAKNILDKMVFNSPDTSFGQPFLGSVIKLESVMFGGGKAHFVQVEDNAKYKLITKEAQEDALKSSEDIADLTNPFNAGVMFTVYQSYLTIYVNGITRANYGMSFNSRANYDYSFPIDNNTDGGIKQREIDLTRYLIPGVQSFNNNDYPINNWNRESSVYIKTKQSGINDVEIDNFPLPQNTPSLAAPDGTSSMVEFSRFNIGEVGNCDKPEREEDIKVVSYYGSMKNIIPNQWGQINSFTRIDTGYNKLVSPASGKDTFFGGDVFISRFSFKTKLPFFIDNRVGAPNDSDVFYDELGNVAYPKFWHSARSILSDYVANAGSSDQKLLRNIISIKANNFDCPNNPALYTSGPGSLRTFYDGYMYLFAYGIPNFYCETIYNTDLRQAFNTKEGDFWPHVSSGIPDDWLQEKNVPIAQDNTYYYNVTFSKQNKENVFSQLPPDWEEELCFTFFPFRAIYSDTQGDSADNKVNNWLVYRALSFHDFPQNYGNLTSLDGMMDRAVLARFDNKALLYNKLLTIDTSNPQAAYIGNPRLFDGAPPVDFAETDLGYVGSQNKFLLKIPYGAVTADAKRGQIFLMSGAKALDLTKFGSGVNRYMTNHLPFEILEYFPDVNTDNHFAGIGLHGVYDSKFDRIIITKLDYIPINDEVQYDVEGNYFYIQETESTKKEVFLFDKEYFCNKSWTISFDFSTKSWISFHSYLPNFYIGENNFYYSGINNCCTNFTAILETPDRSRIDKEDPQLEVVVGELGPPVELTTTTTTTGNPLFTTTTTTAYVPDCDFDIALVEELGCEIDGVGYITVPDPTTTTICSRPSGLNANYRFVEGYQTVGGSPVITNQTLQNACAAQSLVAGSAGAVLPISFPVEFDAPSTEASQAPNLLGKIVYFLSDNSCNVVPDGWYSLTLEQDPGAIVGLGTVYYIVDGQVVNVEECTTVTTTTTFYTGELEECAGLLLNTSANEVRIYNTRGEGQPDYTPDGQPLNLVGYYTPVLIPGLPVDSKPAVGPSTLYAWNGTVFKKWNIDTTNWSAVADTDVTPTAFTSTAGLVAKDDDTLIGIDTSLNSIVEIDTTTGDVSVKFTIAAGYTYTTNLLYTLTGKLITVREDTATGDLEYVQWDYDNAVSAPEINFTITNANFDTCVGIYEQNTDIYIIGEDAGDYYQFVVTKSAPFNSSSIVEIVDWGAEYSPLGYINPFYNVVNITQQASCVTKDTDQEVTTTTTTTLGTTTTTTSIYACYEWEVTGPIAFFADDCNGQQQVYSAGTGETITYCTNTNVGAEGTLVGPCNI